MLAAAVVIVALALAATAGAQTKADPPQHLRRGIADRGLPGLRQGARSTTSPAPTCSRRRSGTAPRPTSSPRRPGQHAAAVRRRPRREACHLHRQPARADRAEIEPGRDHVRLRPEDEGRQARDRELRRAGRERHAHGAEEDGAQSVLSKVVSQESDVKAVTGKVALGQADAGFVYATDARAVSDRVTVIRIPALARQRVRYEIAVVARSGNKVAARAWIEGSSRSRGRRHLKKPASFRFPRRRHRQGVSGDARPCDGRRPAVSAAADRGDLPSRPAGRPDLRARHERCEGRVIVTAETNAVAMVLIILFGTPTAYWVAKRTSRSRDWS